MNIVEKLTKELLGKITGEFKKDENKQIVHTELVTPLVAYISQSLIKEFFPFILVGITIVILTFLFALIIMILLIKKIC